MKFWHLIPALLNLFDGEGGAAAPSAGGTQGDTTGAGSVPTRRGKSGEYDNVKFGKQPQATAETTSDPAPVAGEQRGETITTSNTLEERRKAYEELKAEYKDFFAEDTQKLINRRFSETKTLEDQLAKNQPIIDLLSTMFNIKDDPAKLLSALQTNTNMWTTLAEEAGMEPEAFMKYKQMESQNKAVMDMLQRQQDRQKAIAEASKRAQEANALKTEFKSFDFEREMQNPRFANMVARGVPMREAFISAHYDEILDSAVKLASAKTEKKVVDNVRAKGSRPAENGAASQSAFTVKDDPSKWSKKDRQEAIRRARSGEMIYL